MAKAFRYSLAACFFAASVGCLALWWRSTTTQDVFNGLGFVSPSKEVVFGASQGLGAAYLTASQPFPSEPWHRTTKVNEAERHYQGAFVAKHGYFSAVKDGDGIAIQFPLWYPALIFTLAGVGVIRFRRQFSIRSALIAFAVVAALLAMPLTL